MAFRHTLPSFQKMSGHRVGIVGAISSVIVAVHMIGDNVINGDQLGVDVTGTMMWEFNIMCMKTLS